MLVVISIVSNIKRYLHHFKLDLINNMDQMRISSTLTSSVIRRQTK